jgi:hypothetical protein
LGADEVDQQRVVLVVLDDRFLAGEVAEERHVRDLGGRRDLLDRGGVVAVGQEQPQRVLLDGLPGSGFPLFPQPRCW